MGNWLLVTANGRDMWLKLCWISEVKYAVMDRPVTYGQTVPIEKASFVYHPPGCTAEHMVVVGTDALHVRRCLEVREQRRMAA